MDRREFVWGGVATGVTVRVRAIARPAGDAASLVARVDHGRVLRAAAIYMKREPVTITAVPSSKSPGGVHDYFSEADYFWPNPANPSGSYKEIDGKSNPANFADHRKAMIRLSVEMPALTAAFVLTGKKEYARSAAAWLRAWFVMAETRMNPHLEYAQGYKGGPTGRSYGVIGTLHLVEVARAATRVQPAMSSADWEAVRGWFTAYLTWMNTSKKGSTERDSTNNHATCWGLQAAEFARLTGDDAMRGDVRRRYETVLLPRADGGGRELSAGDGADQAVRVFDLQLRCDGDAGVVVGRARGGAVHASRRARDEPRRGVAGTVSCRQEQVAVRARRGALGELAGAVAGVAGVRSGVWAAGLARAMGAA
jgi:hypothetical protein